VASRSGNSIPREPGPRTGEPDIAASEEEGDALRDTYALDIAAMTSPGGGSRS